MLIQGIDVSEDVLTTKFACDYSVCQGACCHIPSDKYEGCIVTSAEALFIGQHRKLLTEMSDDTEQRSLIMRHPTYTNEDGTFVSMLSSGMCCLECNGHCALNTLRNKGILDYGNPIACALYPLVFEDNTLSIGHYYDDAKLCVSGYAKGKADNIYLVEFCKDAITRNFGTKFYEELKMHLHDTDLDTTLKHKGNI